MRRTSKVFYVTFIVAVIIVAIFSYEFFMVNSLSGYTKVTITALRAPYSIEFGALHYNISLLQDYILNSPALNLVVFVTTYNSSQSFAAIQGHRYSFSGLQIVVGSMNINESYSLQLILYIKCTSSNSKPTISYPAT